MLNGFGNQESYKRAKKSNEDEISGRLQAFIISSDVTGCGVELKVQ